MPINYGRRNPGLLTAASPGDTLYIPLAFYNDSGASISIGGTLAVTDIELFKNGGVAQRATDSGYAILGDTGNFDNRIGFKGISIKLFNTADDANFYAIGAQYWVAIDSVTVDARTVRFFPAVFEIGTERANVTQVDGDTGAADVLQKFADGAGALNPSGDLDTGSVANSSYLPADVKRWLTTAVVTPTLAGVPKVEVSTLADTGIQDRLNKIAADTDTGIQSSVNVTGIADTGLNDRLAKIAADTDTGIQSSVTATGVTGFSDTGIQDRLNKIASDTDTGIQSSVNVTSLFDTGIQDRLAKIAADTDTGIQSSVNVTSLFDTGIQDRLAKIAADTDTGIQSSVNVTSLADTGLNDRLAKIAADTDTGIPSPDTGAILSALNLQIIETGLKRIEAERGMAAVLLGKVSGGGTGTEIFRNAVADTKARVTATTSAAGNRTGITYNLDT